MICLSQLLFTRLSLVSVPSFVGRLNETKKEETEAGRAGGGKLIKP